MKPQRSKIGWTDFSGGDLNFVARGVAPGDCEVSPGCAHCYAAALLRRFGSRQETTHVDGLKLARLLTARFDAGVEEFLGWDARQPFRRGRGSRPLAFVCDMGDLGHDLVPDVVIQEFLGLVAARPDVDWQVLTKRPARLLAGLRAYGRDLPQLWLGVSVENQATAVARIPVLLATPHVGVRFVSCEPLLDAVSLAVYLAPRWLNGALYEELRFAPGLPGGWLRPRLDWVIVGAESGPARRPFDVRWAEALFEECRAAGVPFFGKQASALLPGRTLLIHGAPAQEFPVSAAV